MTTNEYNPPPPWLRRRDESGGDGPENSRTGEPGDRAPAAAPDGYEHQGERALERDSRQSPNADLWFEEPYYTQLRPVDEPDDERDTASPEHRPTAEPSADAGSTEPSTAEAEPTTLPPLPKRTPSPIPPQHPAPTLARPPQDAYDYEPTTDAQPVLSAFDPPAGAQPDHGGHGYDTPPGAGYDAPADARYDGPPNAVYDGSSDAGYPDAGYRNDGPPFELPPQGPGFDAPSGPGFDVPPAPEPLRSGPVYSWAPPEQQQSQPPIPRHAAHPVPPPPTAPWQPAAPAQRPQAQPASGSVNDLSLLKRAKRPPRSGWRRAIHRLTGGAINPGESAADIAYRELVDRVNQPVRGDYRIAILSLKGGVGKTTTTVGLGSTFSSLRGDRVIAIDANPDLGTLAHRVPRQTRSTVRNLLEDQAIHRYSDVRAHTSQAQSRLEILASEQDPAVSEAFSAADYRKAIGILQQFYNIILTDCGTGLMHSAMSGVLEMSSSLVLVTSPAIDGARSASATLDWLEHHGYGKLVERTVVVVNSSRRGASTVDLDQLRRLFLDRTRAVQVIPFDDHLAEGAEIDLELVGKPTRSALLELAAMVADDFTTPH